MQGYNPLSAIDTATPTESGPPPLENGEYIVKISDVKFTGQNKYLVFEFTVDQVISGTSPVGASSSWVRDLHSKGWENYLKTFILKLLGCDINNPEQVAQWGAYCSKLAMIAVTKVADDIVPGHKVGPTVAENGGLIGRKLRLNISTGSKDNKGKYYPRQDFSVAA